MLGRALVLTFVLGLAAAPAAAQLGSTDYADPASHFRIRAAKGWTRAADELLETINETQDRMNPWRTWTVTQAWQRSSNPDVAYPFVRLEVTSVDLSMMTFAEVEKAFDASTRPDKAALLGQPAATLIRQLTDEQPLLDRQRKRVIEKNTTTDSTGVPVTRLYVGFLGQNCAAHLVLVADTRTLETYLPEFQQFIDGFRWDQGWQYVEAKSSNGVDLGWTANRSKAQIDACRAEEKKLAAEEAKSEPSPRRYGRGRLFGFGGVGVGIAVVVGIIIRAMVRD